MTSAVARAESPYPTRPVWPLCPFSDNTAGQARDKRLTAHNGHGARGQWGRGKGLGRTRCTQSHPDCPPSRTWGAFVPSASATTLTATTPSSSQAGANTAWVEPQGPARRVRLNPRIQRADLRAPDGNHTALQLDVHWTPSAWSRFLGHGRGGAHPFWEVCRGSNPRPPVYRTAALTTEPLTHFGTAARSPDGNESDP